MNSSKNEEKETNTKLMIRDLSRLQQLFIICALGKSQFIDLLKMSFKLMHFICGPFIITSTTSCSIFHFASMNGLLNLKIRFFTIVLFCYLLSFLRPCEYHFFELNQSFTFNFQTKMFRFF